MCLSELSYIFFCIYYKNTVRYVANITTVLGKRLGKEENPHILDSSVHEPHSPEQRGRCVRKDVHQHFID